MQAKQLRTDIETAQSSAADILAKAARNEELRQGVRDARSKLRLLEQEVAFNHDLAGALEQVQTARRSIGHIQDLLGRGHLFKAVERFLHGESELGSLHSDGNINAIALLQDEMRELHREIVRELTRGWHDVIRIDTQASTVSLQDDVERRGSNTPKYIGLCLLTLGTLTRPFHTSASIAGNGPTPRADI